MFIIKFLILLQIQINDNVIELNVTSTVNLSESGTASSILSLVLPWVVLARLTGNLVTGKLQNVATVYVTLWLLKIIIIYKDSFLLSSCLKRRN